MSHFSTTMEKRTGKEKENKTKWEKSFIITWKKKNEGGKGESFKNNPSQKLEIILLT